MPDKAIFLLKIGIKTFSINISPVKISILASKNVFYKGWFL